MQLEATVLCAYTHNTVCVCVFVGVPDSSGAEGGWGASGDVGVVFGIQLIIYSILQRDKTYISQWHSPI